MFFRDRAGASSLDDVELIHVLKVADVAGSEGETELQSGGRDQQILESDGHALLGSFAFDASSELG
jgi:hypothetical protein